MGPALFCRWIGDLEADGQPGGAGGAVQVRKVDEFAEPDLIRGFGLGVCALDVTGNESTLAVALVGSSQVWLVGEEDGAIRHTLQGHQLRVNSVAFSPGGLVLASGSRDGTVRLWDVDSGLLLRTLENHSDAVDSVAFSPDGRLIASASDDGTVIVWSLTQHQGARLHGPGPRIIPTPLKAGFC